MAMSGIQILVFLVALVILTTTVFTRHRRTALGNLPPGPPGHDHTALLEGHRWNTFKAWNDKYGRFISFNLLIFSLRRPYVIITNNTGSVVTFFIGPQRNIGIFRPVKSRDTYSTDII
jgi:hypothetical protein